MRNLIIFMVLVAIFVLGFRNCHTGHFNGFGTGVRGKGPVNTETRSISGFHGVQLSTDADVEVSVSDHFSVEVTAQENILPILKTEVSSGGILKIYFDENVGSYESIKIKVSAPNFDEFTIAGSGKVNVITPLQSEKMDISIAGSGDVILPQGTLGNVKCEIAGSGSVELGGTANLLETEIAGSGDIKAKDLTTNDLDSEISGSGSVHAHVVKNLKASIAGSGDIFYTGEPAVDADVSGSGKVKKE